VKTTSSFLTSPAVLLEGLFQTLRPTSEVRSGTPSRCAGLGGNWPSAIFTTACSPATSDVQLIRRPKRVPRPPPGLYVSKRPAGAASSLPTKDARRRCHRRMPVWPDRFRFFRQPTARGHFAAGASRNGAVHDRGRTPRRNRCGRPANLSRGVIVAGRLELPRLARQPNLIRGHLRRLRDSCRRAFGVRIGSDSRASGQRLPIPTRSLWSRGRDDILRCRGRLFFEASCRGDDVGDPDSWPGLICRQSTAAIEPH
jgi:hypothetical protein